jgi:predicted component of type VI protein secretion system
MLKIKVIHNQTGESQEVTLVSEALAEGKGLIGRHPKCDLVLNGSDVSRVHARLINQAGKYYFSDLGSTSGSIVNDEAAQTNENIPLQLNDIIRIGDFMLLVRDVKSTGASPAKSAVVLARRAASFVLVSMVVMALLAATGYISLPFGNNALEQFLSNR